MRQCRPIILDHNDNIILNHFIHIHINQEAQLRSDTRSMLGGNNGKKINGILALQKVLKVTR